MHTHSPVFRGVPPHLLQFLEIFSSTVDDSEAPKPNAGPHKLRECLPLIAPGTKRSAKKKCSTSHRFTFLVEVGRHPKFMKGIFLEVPQQLNGIGLTLNKLET